MAETAMVVDRILNYVNHLAPDYLATIVNSTSLSELFKLISELLQAENSETVDLTCLLLRDLVLHGSRAPACQEFIENYPDSLIVKTLESLLFSSNHFIRKQVIYTLGKTCSYSSLSALSQAFNTWRDTDPILLPRLLGEIAWLGVDNFGELVEALSSSQGYTTRWAVIEVLSQFVEQVQDETFQLKYKDFARLRQDSNYLVRSEAEYEYQVLKFRTETQMLPRAERKKKRKELERQYKPILHFASMATAFEYHLYSNGLNHYSVDELEAFIEAMSAT